MSEKLLEKAREYFEYATNWHSECREEAKEIIAFNHNQHYTIKQLNTLVNRKQPAETFNIIKSYKRVISGYLASTISNINVKPVGIEDINIASVGQDIVQYTLRISKFDRMKTRLIDDLFLAGLCAFEIRVEDTGKKDEFGTKDVQIKLRYLPWDEVIPDPKSREEDYSDARYIHKYRWISAQDIDDTWPGKSEEINKSVGFIGIDNPDSGKAYKYKMNDSYLVITSYLKEDGKIWELVWSGDTLLEKTEVTHLQKFPIMPIYLERDEKGFYGIFREVLESQKAINQALIQIQLLANVNKVYINKTAVDSVEEFTKVFNRVNAIIPMKDIHGVKIDNLNGDVIAQYTIIDRSLQRIKTILNLNDSFLGMMGSSASGRQIKLQQNMTASALNYITSNIEYMYECIGINILDFAKLFYRAYKMIRIADQRSGDRFIELNKPFLMPNEETGKEEIVIKDITYDDHGNATIIPWIEKETQIEFLEYDIEITTANYNETDDIEKLQLDQLLSGQAGNFLMNTDPASYGKVVALSMRAMKTRNSEYIADIFEQVANKLAGAETRDPRDANGGADVGAGDMGSIMSAIGMSNDAAPDGYNRPQE